MTTNAKQPIDIPEVSPRNFLLAICSTRAGIMSHMTPRQAAKLYPVEFDAMLAEMVRQREQLSLELGGE